MYHALSLALTGNQRISFLLRLVTTHAMLKYESSIISAFHDAFPNASNAHHISIYNESITQALTIGVWGTDDHLFALSLLLNRPILQFNTFYNTLDGQTTLTLRNVTDVQNLETITQKPDVTFCTVQILIESYSPQVQSTHYRIHLFQYSMCVISTGYVCYNYHLTLSHTCQFPKQEY